MTPRERLRRVGILCCRFLGNLAFYRAWHKAGRPNQNQQFWVNANGNFLDMAVLEWCKFFGDPRGKHHFSKVVTDVAQFEADLFAELGLNEAEFGDYVNEMRVYRDKFVAHLDDLPITDIPELTVALNSTILLYDYLLANEEEDDAFQGAPKGSRPYYRQLLREGKAVYGA